MSKDKKITDEKLEEEILQGKTQKEIADEYGYGYPSSALSRRIQKMDLQRFNKLNETRHGGATLSFKSEVVEKIRKRNGFNEDENIFYRQKVRDDGRVVLVFNSEKWVEKE